MPAGWRVGSSQVENRLAATQRLKGRATSEAHERTESLHGRLWRSVFRPIDAQSDAKAKPPCSFLHFLESLILQVFSAGSVRFSAASALQGCRHAVESCKNTRAAQTL